MERSTSLSKRLREVLLDGRWIANTNYKEQIENLSWEQATHKLGRANSIAALIFHINYYTAGILQVFNGGELEIRDKYSFDLPPLTSDADWKALTAEFLMNAEKFVEAVAKMPDDQLDKPFVDEKYGTYARNIEGVIEHCYYHLGQISLLRKQLAVGN